MTNRNYRNIVSLILFSVLVMMGCAGNGGASNEPQVTDTIYTEAKAMSIHRTEPERALVMIDSAVIVGNITWQRGEYLKAVTQYGGFNNMPQAREICLDLLAKKDATDDSVTIERTYLLLTSIEYTSGNQPAIIRYATEGSRLAHALDMPSEVGKMEGYIANAMAKSGKTDEGVSRLLTVISELRAMDSFDGINAYHTTAKKLLHILLDNERFAEMVPVCESMLERIGELSDHPDHFSGIQEGFDVSEFVDFARGQTLAFLTAAYARQATQHAANPTIRAQFLSKARATDAEMQRTKWSQSVDCAKMMSAVYHHMGEFDRFEKAMNCFENSYPDTINPNYLICLEQRSEAAMLQGRPALSAEYLRRAYTIRDSLDRRNQRDQLNELATVYHLQEEQLARQQAEADARFFRWITAAIVMALIIALAFAVYFFYKRRETLRKNRALYELIVEQTRQQTHPQPLPHREGLGVGLPVLFTTRSAI